MKYVTLLGLLLVLVLVAPVLTIASLNTLFNLSISYTIWTYLSVLWLNVVTFGSISTVKK